MSVVITVNGVNIDINTDDDHSIEDDDEPISIPLPGGYELLAPASAANETISAVALAAGQTIAGHEYAKEFFKARCEEAEDDEDNYCNCSLCIFNDDDD